MRFVDTNVLIYAVSPWPQEAEKRRRAQELLEHGDLTLSVQVLREFYGPVTRPNRTDPLTDTQALDSSGPSTASRGSGDAGTVSHRRVDQPAAPTDVTGTVRLSPRRVRRTATWSSEDVSAEQDYDGLRAIDPFQ